MIPLWRVTFAFGFDKSSFRVSILVRAQTVPDAQRQGWLRMKDQGLGVHDPNWCQGIVSIDEERD